MARVTEERIEHEIGPDGRLVLRGVSGDIEIVATEGTTAVVIASIQGGAKLNVDKSAGQLRVEQVERGMLGGIFANETIDFEVRVPAGAFVDIRSVSGDIAASRLRGEQTYNTVSGDIAMNDVNGRLSLLTVSGDIEVSDGGSVEVAATTTSGDQAIEARAIGRLTARSVSGDIEVTGALAVGPRHTVETVSGDFSLDSETGATVELTRAVNFGNQPGPVVVGDGSARVVFRTMSGDPDIRGGQASRPSAPTSAADTRMEVLQALERGEIDVDEATRRLEEMSNA